jgi:hypothetical protein
MRILLCDYCRRPLGTAQTVRLWKRGGGYILPHIQRNGNVVVHVTCADAIKPVPKKVGVRNTPEKN